MLLIVFGAGASYDSVPEDSWTGEQRANSESQPPLGVQLFSPRRHFVEAIGAFPPANELVAELRPAVAAGRDIEADLERLVEWEYD